MASERQVPVEGVSSIQRLLLLDDAALLGRCTERHLRASGPGGQKRNKTSSAVRLAHQETGVVVTAGDDRSQRVNKVHALRRLREAIAFTVRSAVGDGPSALITSVRSEAGRFEVSLRDPRYYAVVAEVLDVFVAVGCELSRTADFLGLTTAALTKFLARDPHFWAAVQTLRRARGLSALRS